MENLLAAWPATHAQPTLAFVLIVLAVVCEIVAFFQPKISNPNIQPLGWGYLGVGFFFASLLAS